MRIAPGAKLHLADAAPTLAPQRMSLRDKIYWIQHANGICVSVVTRLDARLPTDSMLSVVILSDPLPHMAEGLGLLRTMTPDDADEFADQLKASAQAIRDAAGEQAAAALRKASGR